MRNFENVNNEHQLLLIATTSLGAHTLTKCKSNFWRSFLMDEILLKTNTANGKSLDAKIYRQISENQKLRTICIVDKAIDERIILNV